MHKSCIYARVAGVQSSDSRLLLLQCMFCVVTCHAISRKQTPCNTLALPAVSGWHAGGRARCGHVGARSGSARRAGAEGQGRGRLGRHADLHGHRRAAAGAPHGAADELRPAGEGRQGRSALTALPKRERSGCGPACCAAPAPLLSGVCGHGWSAALLVLGAARRSCVAFLLPGIWRTSLAGACCVRVGELGPCLSHGTKEACRVEASWKGLLGGAVQLSLSCEPGTHTRSWCDLAGA